MAKKWRQVGGDVNPKDHGAVLANVDDDKGGVTIVRIEPNEDEDEGKGWHVLESHFYATDLNWDGGQANPREMSLTMGFTRDEWEKTDLANRGAIALQYHGSNWAEAETFSKKWSEALPAKTNQIQWWR